MTAAADLKKTVFLKTVENPNGWTIEDLLTVLQNDMVIRCQKIIGDTRPEARAVFNNNVEIMGYLTKCIEKARESTQLLNRAFGPHKEGEPRIGVG